MTTKQLEGGRKWHRSMDGWRTHDGVYRIIPTQEGAKLPWLLISFIHDGKDGEPFHKRFPTVEAAMEHAEKM